MVSKWEGGLIMKYTINLFIKQFIVWIIILACAITASAHENILMVR